MLERGNLVVMRLDERMGHRALDRDAKFKGCRQRRRTGKAGDVAGARGEHPGFGAMRPPQPEIDEGLAFGREHQPGRLGRDDRLEMHEVDQPGLDELRLRQRCDDPQDRLVRKEHGSFRQRVDIAGEPQP